MSVYAESATWSDLLELLAMLSVPATILATARWVNLRGERRDRRARWPAARRWVRHALPRPFAGFEERDDLILRHPISRAAWPRNLRWWTALWRAGSNSRRY